MLPSPLEALTAESIADFWVRLFGNLDTIVDCLQFWHCMDTLGVGAKFDWSESVVLFRVLCGKLD